MFSRESLRLGAGTNNNQVTPPPPPDGSRHRKVSCLTERSSKSAPQKLKCWLRLVADSTNTFLHWHCPSRWRQSCSQTSRRLCSQVCGILHSPHILMKCLHGTQHTHSRPPPTSIHGISVHLNRCLRTHPRIKTDANRHTPKLKRTQTDTPIRKHTSFLTTHHVPSQLLQYAGGPWPPMYVPATVVENNQCRNCNWQGLNQ